MNKATTETKKILKQRLLKGGTWALIGKIFTASSGLIVNILIARMLTPEEYGEYFLIITLVSIIITITTFGFDKGILKFLSAEISNNTEGNIPRIIKGVFVTIALSTLLVIVILYLGLFKYFSEIFNASVIYTYSWIIAIWIFLATFQRILAESFKGLHKINLATIFGGAVRGGIVYYFLFIVVLLVYFSINVDIGLKRILELNLTVMAASLIAALIFFRKQINPRQRQSESENFLFSPKIKIVLPILLTNIINILLARSDIWLIGLFLSSEKVAYYGAAMKLMLLVNSSLIIVNAFLPPIISDLFSKNEKALLEQTLRSVATVTAIPALLILIVYILFSGSILNLVYGDAYTKGNMVLVLLSIGQLFNVWAGSCGFTLMMTGNERPMLVTTISTGIITIIISLLLIGPLGIVGIAIAFAVRIILQNVWMIILVKYKLGIWSQVYLSINGIRLLIKSINNNLFKSTT